MEQIVGYIERITFHNGENGFTVAHIQQPGHSELTCVVGFMPSIKPGETVRCFGEWEAAPRPRQAIRCKTIPLRSPCRHHRDQKISRFRTDKRDRPSFCRPHSRQIRDGNPRHH